MICNGDYRFVFNYVLHDVDDCVLVTDPPFNIGYKYATYNDKMVEEDYLNMLKELFDMFKRRVFILYPETLHKLSIKVNIAPDRVCSWVYNSNTAKQHRDIGFYGFMPDFRKRGQEYKNPNDKRIKKLIKEGKRARLYDWWNINQVKNTSKEKTEHPCQMPLDVMLNVIGTLPDGVCVVDPFMGSGTTGVACKCLGYDFIGVEIDKGYFDIARKRIDNAQIL